MKTRHSIMPRSRTIVLSLVAAVLLPAAAFAQAVCIPPATGIFGNFTPPHWWDNVPPQSSYYQNIDDPRWVGAGRRPVTAAQVLRKADIPAAGAALGVEVPPRPRTMADIRALPRLDAPPWGPARPYSWQNDTPGTPIRTSGETVVLARSAVQAPPPPPPAAAPPPGFRRLFQHRAWLLGALGGGVLVAALILAGLALGNHPPATVSRSFPPVLVGATVSTQRVWRLSGDRLTAEVKLRNIGSAGWAAAVYNKAVTASQQTLRAEIVVHRRI